MKKIRILIADDHKLMRMGLISLIRIQPDMAVVGEAEDGESAVRLANELRPDIVIMDLMMPEVNGAEATRRILERNPETGIVILSSFGNSIAMRRAVSYGARGAQLKESPTEDLIDAVRAIAAGQKAINPEIRKLLDEESQSPELTERQANILRSVTRGLTNEEIGKEFGISPVSVKKHLSVIFAKLNVSNRSEATAVALRRQLLKA